MGFPILVRRHLYIESGPWSPSALWQGLWTHWGLVTHTYKYNVCVSELGDHVLGSLAWRLFGVHATTCINAGLFICTLRNMIHWNPNQNTIFFRNMYFEMSSEERHPVMLRLTPKRLNRPNYRDTLCALCRRKSLKNRPNAYSQADLKRNTKALDYWPLSRACTGHQWFPLTKD